MRGEEARAIPSRRIDEHVDFGTQHFCVIVSSEALEESLAESLDELVVDELEMACEVESAPQLTSNSRLESLGSLDGSLNDSVTATEHDVWICTFIKLSLTLEFTEIS